MKVLMFGWEFPPLSSGGLGTACYGLTKALSKQGISITLVLPHAEDIDVDFLKIVSPNIKIKRINTLLKPYLTSSTYSNMRNRMPNSNIYGSTLFEEVYRYTQAALEIAQQEDFDIIHCHDWMTFGAGIKAKEISHKPLVIHVHATEFDRTGGNSINPYVYHLEKQGMQQADAVIAVSHFTKNKIAAHYDINPEKIAVVHNAIDNDVTNFRKKLLDIKKYNKLVLFLGRITLQKGPDYFLYAAKKVLDYDKNITFIMAGSGDMEASIIEKAAELGIADKILFAGFLRGTEVDLAYQQADVYVMPSVSEPFGLTALEAMKNEVPIIISKQSGVSEVVTHCLKVDFWDVHELANKILSTLRYKTLYDSLKENASREIKRFSWDIPAQKCIDVYQRVLGVADG